MVYQSQEQARTSAPRLRRSVLLQRHPVLVPLALIGGSLFFGGAALVSFTLPGEAVASFFTGFATFCLSLACVLGITGSLAAITGLLTLLDRYGSLLPISLLSRLKE